MLYKIILGVGLWCSLLQCAIATEERQVTRHHLRKMSRTLKPKSQLMDVINDFRAQICSTMHGKHGEDFTESFTACKSFMAEMCNKGEGAVMDDEGHELKVSKEHCEAYFKEQEAEADLKDVEEEEEKEEKEQKKTEAKESIKTEEKTEVHKSTSAPTVPAKAPAEAPAAAQEPDTKTTPAPAPAVAGPSSAAPAPAAQVPGVPAAAPPGVSPEGFTPGKSKGKPSDVEEDESYYYKKGGKSMDRMHMDGDLKMPSQGYWGKLVEHDDQQTFTSDWRAEFGPASNPRTYSEICKKYPGNAWCKRHIRIHGNKDRHSSGYRASIHLVLLLIPLVIGGHGW